MNADNGRSRSGQLAAFAYGLRARDIPEDVMRSARLHLLDFIGVAAAGCAAALFKATLAAEASLRSKFSSCIAGSGIDLPVDALLNRISAFQGDASVRSLMGLCAPEGIA